MAEDLSIVIPVYNEEESIPELLEWIFRVVDANNISTEILMVDDGSTDSSWSVIAETSKSDRRVRGFRFKRNYGGNLLLYKRDSMKR